MTVFDYIIEKIYDTIKTIMCYLAKEAAAIIQRWYSAKVFSVRKNGLLLCRNCYQNEIRVNSSCVDVHDSA